MSPKTTRYYTYVKPFLKNKSVRTYSSVIFTLLTVSIFAVYAIRPTILTIVSLQKSIEEQQKVSQELGNKRNNLSVGKNNYDQINPDLKTKLINLIPASPTLPRVIVSLTNLATANEATISGIQFQPLELEPINTTLNKDATINDIEITFSFQGQYSQQRAILDELKKLDRLFEIQSVNMSKQGEDSLLMTVSGKIKYLK